MSGTKKNTGLEREVRRQVELAVVFTRLELQLETAAATPGREHLQPFAARITKEVLDSLHQVKWTDSRKGALGDLAETVKANQDLSYSTSVKVLMNAFYVDAKPVPSSNLLPNWRQEAQAWLAWFDIQRQLSRVAPSRSEQIASYSRQCDQAIKDLDSLAVLSPQSTRTLKKIQDQLEQIGCFLESLESGLSVRQAAISPPRQPASPWHGWLLKLFRRRPTEAPSGSPVVELLDWREIEELRKQSQHAEGPLALAEFAWKLQDPDGQNLPGLLTDLAVGKHVQKALEIKPANLQGLVRLLVLTSVELRLREWAAEGKGNSDLWKQFHQFQALFGRPAKLKVQLEGNSQDNPQWWLNLTGGKESRRRRLFSPIVTASKDNPETVVLKGVLTDELPVECLRVPLRKMQRFATEYDSLTDCCRELLQSMEHQRTVKGWWSSLSNPSQRDPVCELIWRLFAWGIAWSGEEPNRLTLVNDLLLAFARAGFRIVAPEGDGSDKQEPLCQQVHRALLPSGKTHHASKLLAVGPGGMAALRTPDGQLFQPVLWLRTPTCWDGHPVAQLLFDLEPLALMLRRTEPDWTGWQQYDAALGRMLFQTDAVGPAEAAQLVQAVVPFFVRLLNWQQAPPEARKYAAAIYRSMSPDQRAHLPLPLYLDTLEVDVPQVLDRLEEQELENLEIRWKVASEPHRTVLTSKMQLGGCSLLELSLGADFPRDEPFVSWLQLPLPPLPAGLEGTGTRNPLRCIYHQIILVAARPDEARMRWEQCLAEMETIVQAEESREWFNAFLREVVAGTEPLCQWYRKLKEQPWWTCYPAYDDQQGRICWPTGLRLTDRLAANCGLRWEFDETTPRGQLCDSPYFFAVVPTAAKATFSRGPHHAAEATAEAALTTLVEAVESLPPEPGEKLLLLARQLLFALEARLYAEQSDEPETNCIPAMLDVLNTWASSDPGQVQLADDLLTKVRTVAKTGFGLVIEPEAWTYRDGLDATAITPPPTAEQFQFDSDVPAGKVILRSLGVSGERRFEFSVSAGPAPLGFHELQESMQNRDRVLAEHLAQWPQDACKGRLKSVAEQFFENNWESLKEPEKAALKSLLKAQFRLETFEPRKVSDVDREWLEGVSASTAQSGAVTCVHRPGLRDEANQLRVRAKVDVQ